MEDIVKKRQTLNLIEKDMETWLKVRNLPLFFALLLPKIQLQRSDSNFFFLYQERKKLGQSLEKYTNKKQNLIETGQVSS